MREALEEVDGGLGAGVRVRAVERRDETQRYLGLAFQALSDRVLLIAAALLGGFLWTYAVLNPTWIRYAVVGGYTLSFLLPILYADARGSR